MTFGNPLMLWGALAALIPLAIHLFDRRRPRPHPFAAISFVLRSQRRTASRLKLKRLILYSLRTLILLAIPIALARPEWKRDAAVAATARGPAATAIILDGSLSMRWAQGESLFERGRDEARDALRDLLPEEPANFILCTNRVNAPASPAFDRQGLRAAIDEATPTYAPSELNRCLDLAARSLEESPMPGKRLVVISDLTAPALRLEAPAPTLTGKDGQVTRPEVVLRGVGPERLPNHAIVDLKVEPAPQSGPRTYAFTFTVRNFSDAPVNDLEAALKLGDQVKTKAFLSIPAGGTVQKTLTQRFDVGGAIAGEISLTPDALSEDDRRAFLVHVPKGLKALVVNGAPHAVRYRDESFFVDAALTAPGSPVEEAVRDPEAAAREDLTQYDLVLLLNVPTPTPEFAARLTEFVQRGGGLFISMGDMVDPDQYNQRLSAVLPRPLRVVRTAASRDEPDAESKAARLSQVNTDQVVFAPFTGQAREGLMSARFYRYVLLEGEQAGKTGAAETLATYEDGAPAVAVARRGKGRVLLFTSTVDRDWSDFAIRTSFLPLMQRFAAFLSGSLEEREELRPRVGEEVRLHPDDAAVRAVKAPSGEELEAREQEDGTLAIGPLEEPGVYQVLDASSKPNPALAFAATLDPSESDLTRIDEDKLSAYFGEETVRTADTKGPDAKVPLWTWLFVIAAAAFFLEGTLLRK